MNMNWRRLILSCVGLAAIAELPLANAASGVHVLLSGDKGKGIKYRYGTWENPGAIQFVNQVMEISPPATDEGGAGSSLNQKAVLPPSAFIRVIARLGPQNKASGFNIVLKDRDPEGVEHHVYRIPATRLVENDFQTIDIPIAASDLINNRANGVPDFMEGGLEGWEIQGNFEIQAPIHLFIKRVELVIP
ncbi:MAG: hypothetical protein NZ740_07950 [Kiritimatiellae bacterium]|nr:hypothetical protein [Kiritimatiellia bacterium]MDW8459027.1 hypothetical protein [Verrucomicrobiota bacterium]